MQLTYIGENEPWEMVKTPKPTCAEEAVTRPVNRGRWSCFFRRLLKPYSPVPKHKHHDFINQVHNGSLIHELDEAFESPSLLPELRPRSSSCEPALPSNGISPACTEQIVAGNAYEDEVFYDAPTHLFTEEKTVAFAGDTDTSDNCLPPHSMTSPSRETDIGKMGDTLCMVKGRALAYCSASLRCCEYMIKHGDEERAARQVLDLPRPFWNETEQNHEDVQKDTKEQDGEEGKDQAEQQFETVDAATGGEDVGSAIGDYLSNLFAAEAGLSTSFGPPRDLLCYDGQEYKDNNGVLELGGLDWKIGFQEESLMDWHWRYSSVTSLCSSSSSSFSDEELILDSAKKLVETMATEGDTCRPETFPQPDEIWSE